MWGHLGIPWGVIQESSGHHLGSHLGCWLAGWSQLSSPPHTCASPKWWAYRWFFHRPQSFCKKNPKLRIVAGPQYGWHMAISGAISCRGGHNSIMWPTFMTEWLGVYVKSSEESPHKRFMIIPFNSIFLLVWFSINRQQGGQTLFISDPSAGRLVRQCNRGFNCFNWIGGFNWWDSFNSFYLSGSLN